MRERAESKRLHVKVVSEFRITREQNLKSAIQPKSIYLVSANSSPWRIFGLQQSN